MLGSKQSEKCRQGCGSPDSRLGGYELIVAKLVQSRPGVVYHHQAHICFLDVCGVPSTRVECLGLQSAWGSELGKAMVFVLGLGLGKGFVLKRFLFGMRSAQKGQPAASSIIKNNTNLHC